MSRPVFDREGLNGLGARWRTLAARSAASYFQDWGWVGCMAAERYPDPVLFEVHRDGELVGLALFNGGQQKRVGGGTTWYLQESKDPALESIFVEHNGPLLAVADPVLRQAVLAELFAQAMRGGDGSGGATGRPRRLVLSGVGPECADALALTGGTVNEKAVRMAPYANLRGPDTDRPDTDRPGINRSGINRSGINRSGIDRPFIERLSRNTRHQLRRSNRQYEAAGELRVTRADTAEQGLRFMAEMIEFHDRTWRARGKKGAFATPFARKFYQTLLCDGIPGGEVDLLCITAGSDAVGYLMNFVHNDVVSAYQSGFNYAAAGPHQKPGLTSHYLAIEAYRKRGLDEYDFLAGADRYKLSLANAQRWLHWVSVAPAWHPSSVGTRLRHLLHI